jgi:non-heme chloroperoxidase
MRSFEVVTPDSLRTTALESGNPRGPGILFLHGFSQCALAWDRQLGDAGLAGEFRMVAYDLRGHGGSGKPGDPACVRPPFRT